MFGPDDPTVDPGRGIGHGAAQRPLLGADAGDGSSNAARDRRGVSGSSPQVGGYTILRLLGRGGMGMVFEAEQKHPRRRVALKIIRGSRVSPELLRRFEYESQVLARLQHPASPRSIRRAL